MAAEEIAQTSELDKGLAKYTESNLTAIADSKLSQEEWIEKTWEFLTIITDIVEKLPQEVQTKIIEAGRQFASVGASYQHDSNRPHRPPVSPAKLAMINELKTKSSGATQ